MIFFFILVGFFSRSGWWRWWTSKLAFSYFL
jgi:hypothetical protein